MRRLLDAASATVDREIRRGVWARAFEPLSRQLTPAEAVAACNNHLAWSVMHLGLGFPKSWSIVEHRGVVARPIAGRQDVGDKTV